MRTSVADLRKLRCNDPAMNSTKSRDVIYVAESSGPRYALLMPTKPHRRLSVRPTVPKPRHGPFAWKAMAALRSPPPPRDLAFKGQPVQLVTVLPSRWRHSFKAPDIRLQNTQPRLRRAPQRRPRLPRSMTVSTFSYFSQPLPSDPGFKKPLSAVPKRPRSVHMVYEKIDCRLAYHLQSDEPDPTR